MSSKQKGLWQTSLSIKTGVRLKSKISLLIVSAMVALLTGLGIGLPAGSFFRNSALNGNFYLPALCFRPSRNFLEMIQRLDDVDDLKRLSGYYIYRETGLTDLNFLYTRYRFDETVLIRKTIIWIASSEPDKKKLAGFYSKIFEISPAELQNVITARVESLGKEVYIDFVSKHKIQK